MGMSTYAEGIIPADDKYKKMFHIFSECKSVGIEAPKAVMDFFGGEEPCEAGVVVRLTEVSKFTTECSEGLTLDVDKIPENVRTIRFVNLY
jgi:hypothetical protein